MKINKYLLLFFVISAMLICVSVVSANETTQNYMQDEVQQTTDTSATDVTTNDNVKTEINKNTYYKTEKTAISDIKNLSIDSLANNLRAYSGQEFSFEQKIPTFRNYSLDLPTSIVKIDGKTIAKSKVNNGVATLNFTIPELKAGNHTLTFKTEATKFFSAFEKNVTLSIYKRNVTIKTKDVASYAGENVTVKATVKVGDSNVLFDKAVLKIAGKTVAKTLVINGIAVFKFTTPDFKKGTYDMVIKTGENTLYNGASITQKFSVYRNNITITADTITGIAGKMASLKATFKSNGVKNINNIASVLKINGTTVAKSTINDGVAIFYFTVPAIKSGSYDMLIKVGDSTFYNAAELTKKITISTQNITITTSTVNGYAGKRVNLAANFVSSDNKGVDISNSVLKLNGKTVDSKAVINGKANYSFIIPNLNAGDYTLTIKTGDTSLYSSATKNTKLTVLGTTKS